MYGFYSLLLFLSLLIYLPIYFVRIRLLRKEKLYLKERMGLKLPPQEVNKKKSIWIHAVSVGEVISLQNLTKKIKEKHPDWTILFSSLTNTGIRMAEAKIKEADYIFLAPVDFTPIVRRFFKVLRPDVLVLAESEFWPNLLREAQRRAKGVLLINGRISSHSYRRYRKIKFLTQIILKNINHFLVQTGKDRQRLEDMGVESNRIEMVGNLKTEVSLPVLNQDEFFRVRKKLNIDEHKQIFVAGSTRKGEEEKILSAYSKVRTIRADVLLIVVPRHPQRAEEIEKICKNFGLRVERKTSVSPQREWDVLVVDTIGELTTFYALSDGAFVGGSLIPWGGHNLLEPAFYEKPIFFGPHMDNFSFLADRFIQSGAARVVFEEKDLIQMFLTIRENKVKEMGKKAKQTLNSFRGVTEKTIKAVESLMIRRP